MRKQTSSKKSLTKRKPLILENFYKSNEWKLARATKICEVGGRCEKCNDEGKEVHHIIHLTIHNVIDEIISLNQDNLMLLCTDCHNKEHHRFGKHKSYKFDEEGNMIKL